MKILDDLCILIEKKIPDIEKKKKSHAQIYIKPLHKFVVALRTQNMEEKN